MGCITRGDMESPVLPPEHPCIDLLGHLLAHYRQRILTHDPGTRSGEDPEDLHKMRTSSRRLRADLRLCRGVLKKKRARHLGRELAWLARLLGEVRDLDVMLFELPRQQATLPDLPALRFEAFETMLLERRALARIPLLDALEGPRYRALTASLSQATAPATHGKRALVPALDLLRPRLRSTLTKLRAEALAAQLDGTDGQLHRLRIRVKKLRYGCELVDPLLDGQALPFIALLKKQQNVLGAHQDACVAAEWVNRFFLRTGSLTIPEHERWLGGLYTEKQRLRRRFEELVPALMVGLGGPAEPGQGSLAGVLG